MRAVLVNPLWLQPLWFVQLGENVSISRRTSTLVRTLGVASAAAALTVGVAGSAFACNIGDFKATVSCDKSDYTATVQVKDIDRSYALLTLQKNGQDVVPTQTVGISGDGGRSHTATFNNIPWNDVTEYSVHIVVTGQLDSNLAFPAGQGDCSKPTTPPTTKPPTTPPTTPPTKPPTSAPSTAPATTPPTTATTVDATASPSPTGPVLATTGGGSDTGMIAGIAGAFVVVGAGAVFMLRRRSSGSHN